MAASLAERGARPTIVEPVDIVTSHDGAFVVHAADGEDSLPQIAAAIPALELTGAFGQLVLDAGAVELPGGRLEDLGAAVPVRPVGAPPLELLDAIGDELAATPCVAILVCDHDDASLPPRWSLRGSASRSCMSAR